MGRQDGLNRRAFLKIGLASTASAILCRNRISDAAQYASDENTQFAFPKPVYRTLGKTGLKITVVSFGAMLTPEPEVIRIAVDHGLNYIDTARKYMGGKNEDVVGRAIKGIREKVTIATKTLPTSQAREDIVRDVESSLKALGTDYIDVIQLHNLSDKQRVYIAETREALIRLREQGKVRFFGVTTHKNQAEVLNAIVNDQDRFFDTALVAYNFKSDKDVAEAIEKAAKAGIGIIAMKTQAGGYETKELGEISPHQAALKWALQNKYVAAAIPGMKDLSQLKEDIAVMGMPFTYADANILQHYNAGIRDFYCRFCGKCESSCTEKVDISAVSRALMYAEGAYNNRKLALSTYREIPSAFSANACTACAAKDKYGACVARCVNGLDIASRMARARNIFSADELDV